MLPVISQRVLKQSGSVLVVHAFDPMLVHAKSTRVYNLPHQLDAVRVAAHHVHGDGRWMLVEEVQPHVKYDAGHASLE